MKKHSRIILIICIIMAFAFVDGSAYAGEKNDNEANRDVEMSSIDEEISVTEKNLDLPDSEYLLNGFIESKATDSLRSGNSSTKRTRGQRLTGNNKIVYDRLKEEITKTAEGERAEAIINIGLPELSDDNRWILIEDLFEDFDPMEDYTLAEIYTAFYERFNIDANAVVDALVADLPYQFYWFDKVRGWNMSACDTDVFLITTEDGTAVAFDLDDPRYEFKFFVSKDYEPDGTPGTFNVDMNKTAAAAQAAEHAATIVEANSEKSDYEKLIIYRNYICENVSYDNDALAEGTEYGDPWQLIYVFDEVDSTNVVCEGYSKAFQFLCDLSNFNNQRIESHIVTGTMEYNGNSEDHMWNIMHMNDGKNYLIDVTNCDEGNAGEPDGLFLKGVSKGNVTEGYTCDLAEGSCFYMYDTYTRNNYDEYELVLSETDYDSGAEDDISCKHLMTHIKAKEATCTVPGNTEYWHCTECGDYFSDAAGKNKIEEDSWITTKGHSIIKVETRKGQHWFCKGCNHYFSNSAGSTIIDSPSNICYQFSNGTLTFYGKGSMDNMGEGEYETEKSWRKYRTKTKKIVISKGVTFISNFSFRNFQNVTAVSFSPTIYGIGQQAFDSCKKLNNVVLPDNMSYYDSQLFGDCESLTNITFGSDPYPGFAFICTTNFFTGCTRLERINVPEDNGYFKSIDGVLYTKDGRLQCYPAGKKGSTYIVDSSTNRISAWAFSDNPYIVNVQLPSSINIIEPTAFYNCEKLGRVVIPGSVSRPPGFNEADGSQDAVVLACPKASIVNNSDYSILFTSCGDQNGDMRYWFNASTGEPVTKDGKGTFVQIAVKYVSKNDEFKSNGVTYQIIDRVVPDDTSLVNKTTLRKIFKKAPVGRVKTVKNPNLNAVPKTIEYKGFVFNVKDTPRMKLSKTAFTWNNKVQTPGVVVKYYGKTLPKSKYTVTYPKGRKKIGSYTVKIKLKGGYSGTRTATYKINPKGTSLSSLKAVKKAITVKWKKQSGKMPKARINGYQIQYSVNKTFKSGKKTVTVKGYKKTSKKITKLTAKKTYYVRIRTYMKTGGKTYYSQWSGVKSVNVK